MSYSMMQISRLEALLLAKLEEDVQFIIFVEFFTVVPNDVWVVQTSHGLQFSLESAPGLVVLLEGTYLTAICWPCCLS
jgi:hypothetical protein